MIAWLIHLLARWCTHPERYVDQDSTAAGVMQRCQACGALRFKGEYENSMGPWR